MIIYAVVPARSNSIRLKNKNILKLCGLPLFMHSINFAKKLKFVKKIIFTTDSENYINKIRNFKKLIIHKRSKKASKNKAMEEDILKDLLVFFEKKKFQKPDAILWLRPTSPLRSIFIFKKGYQKLIRYRKTVMIVHEEESRLFKNTGNYLIPIQKVMSNRSMIRGQDVKPFYSIFSGEFFMLKKKITKNFLGNKKLFIVSPKYTNVDIDTKEDFVFLSKLIKENKKIYNKFLHV